MNLEAIALRRAEEQEEAGAWRRLDPSERRFVPRILSAPSGRKLSCDCGKCRTCHNREWMAAFRGGRVVARLCPMCGGKVRSDNGSAWCATCRKNRPTKFTRYAQTWVSDGGGI